MVHKAYFYAATILTIIMIIITTIFSVLPESVFIVLIKIYNNNVVGANNI